MPPVIKSAPSKGRGGLLQITLLLAVVLAVLFWRSFLPGYVHFSNDGPLAMQVADFLQLPAAFSGAWDDLNWIGANSSTYPFSITALIRLVLGPVGFAKFLAPIATLILGLCAWTFLKRLKLSSLGCALGAFAASLNSGFLGTACWGVAGQLIGFGMDYLALAMVVSNSAATPRWLRWLRLILAGLAVGMGVMEGADNGAIFSVFVAAYVIYRTLIEEIVPLTRIERGVILFFANGIFLFVLFFAPDIGIVGILIKLCLGLITAGVDWALFSCYMFVKKCGLSVVYVAVIAAFAGIMATQNIVGLVGTAIQGVAGTKQDAETKAANWDFATQWSIPKIETLGLFVPGLFGYRMDTPKDMPEYLKDSYKGGNYWGATGRDLAWDRYFDGGQQGPPPDSRQRVIRSSSGAGLYSGVLVVLVALWAFAQSFRKNDSVFSPMQRRLIWFWLVVMVVTLLLSYGRFAPFYQFLYMLPYASVVRNPCKFSAVFLWALIIVFSYGVHGLSRRYMETTTGGTLSPFDMFKSWWAKARGFDRKWIIGCLAAIVASFIGWAIYANYESQLVAYLQVVLFPEDYAQQIAAFSVRQVFWFVLFLVLSTGALAFVFSGAFSGRRSKLGGLLLGFILIADLGRMDLPYIVHWNYEQKYQNNPIIDRLKVKPYEQRAIMSPFPGPPEMGLFADVYRIEWSQQLFTYNNILSLDIIQMPRRSEEYMAYEIALSPRSPSLADLYLISRRWELTSSRYILGPTITRLQLADAAGKPVLRDFGTLDFLNNDLDGGRGRFRVVTPFEIVPKPGITQVTQYEQLTAVEEPKGRYALYEFTGALPHAALYSHWQVSTNDDATLKTLSSPEFLPHQTVLVSLPLPVAPALDATNQNPGEVKFKSYKPADIVFEARAENNAVLMLNDKFDPIWRVTVDGKPTELLRCNYIMRGVFLTPGTHTVEFFFRPSLKSGYVTLAAMALGILLSGLMIYSERRVASNEQSQRDATSKPFASGKSARGNFKSK